MKTLNYGSLNIDHVYAVDHFVRPGETLTSREYGRFAGGKGANQSVALARAGARVWHAGSIGQDGAWMVEGLRECGVDTRFIRLAEEPTGHAAIQVTPDGENAIVIHGGANRAIASRDVADTLSHFGSADLLLLQNEIACIPAIMRKAAGRGMRVVFNPAPMHADVLDYPLDLVDVFVVNRVEGEQLAQSADPMQIVNTIRRRFGRASVVLTLGAEGAIHAGREGECIVARAPSVKAVDTTAAGDTFTGYFVAGLARGDEPHEALRTAACAAALCVTRRGAAASIPEKAEVDAFRSEHG